MTRQEYDVIIIGTGIAGLGCAAAFVNSGLRVAVLGRQGRGEATPASAGILDPFLEMEKGSPLLDLSVPAFNHYSQDIGRVERRSRRKTDFTKTGMLYLAFSKKESAVLRKWHRWQRHLSVPVRWISSKEAFRLEPKLNPRTQAALFYPTLGRINPKKFRGALTVFLRRSGISVQNTTETAEPVIERQKIKGVMVGRRFLPCGKVVLASGSWAGTSKKPYSSIPIRPVKGQIALLRMNPRPKRIVHSLQGAYLVPWSLTQTLAGSTLESAGFNTRVTTRGIKQIKKRGGKIFPSLRKGRVVRSWAGLRPRAKDHLPVIGESRKVRGLYYAAGYYRSGILIGMHAGRLLAKEILSGKRQPLLKRFAPNRPSLD